MKKQIRIVLVDDHTAVRETWKFFLEKDDRFTIVGQCSDGQEAIEQASALQPDIMLMDINMKPVSGFEATKIIAKQAPAIKIIGMSVNNHPGYANKMMELGAMGFVTKSSPFHELVEAILKVQDGQEYICEEIRNSTSYRIKN